MGTWRTVVLCSLVVAPGLGAACGSSDGKRVLRAQGGEGGGSEPASGGSSVSRGGEPALRAGAPGDAGGEPAVGGRVGAEGGEPSVMVAGQGGGGSETPLVDSAVIGVNSGRFAQIGMLGDLAANGPRYVCDDPAMQHPEQHVGECLVSECQSLGDADDVALGQPPSRGALTLAGGLEDFTLPPDSLGGVTDLFDGGEAMTLSAPAGTRVPAFSFSFTGSAPSVLSAPAWVNHPTAMTVSTASDMTVAWSPVDHAELVVLVLSATVGDVLEKRSIALECAFPMAAGSATVSAALLQSLPTATPAPYSFGIHAEHRQTQTVDGFPLELRVRRALETSTGVYTSNGNVTLE